MAIVTARIKIKGKNFEVSVDVDEALKVRDRTGDVTVALNSNAIYYDLRKGETASNSDLEDAFKTTDIHAIAERIMKEGEIQKPQEYRSAEREAKIKQVIDLVLRNAVDQNGRPYTEERIRRAIDEVHYNFDDRSPEIQMNDLVKSLKKVLPIKIDVKRVKLRIPAQFTGQIYGILSEYKESEEWLSNGDLEAIVAIPVGMQIDFYERLNSVTHGAVQSEELSE